MNVLLNYFIASLWTGRLRQNVLLLLVLTVVGCGDSQDKSISTLTGIWNLELVDSEIENPSDSKFQINFYLEKGWFGTTLKTDCGKGGLFGDWSGNWREAEVEWHRAPEGHISGAVIFKCIYGAFPVSGHLVRGLFYDDRMVGKITYQVDRGNKHIGPLHEARSVHLFVAKRESTPTGKPAKEKQPNKVE